MSEAERRRRLAELVLVRRALAADEAELLRDVFPEIFDAHHDAVWGYLRRHNVQGAAVDDLLQETFASLYKQILDEGFPPGIREALLGMAFGKLLNYKRGLQRDPVSACLPSSGSAPPCIGNEPERAADLHNLLPRVRAELSPEHWEVVELIIVYEATHAEAAEALGIPLGTVKSRVMAAKAQLPELLERLLPPSQRA